MLLEEFLVEYEHSSCISELIMAKKKPAIN